jgi:tRNA-binding EMAP/Myf-like protein
VSEFKVEVVRIGEIEKHPGADTLSITKVFGGYPVIFKTGEFKTGDLAVYVPVDALVPVAREAFNWLETKRADGNARVKAKKLRGIFSMGLLVSLPVDHDLIFEEGDEVSHYMGVTKYLPPAEKEPTNNPQHNLTRKARVSETRIFDRNVILAAAFMSLVGILSLPFLASLLLTVLSIGGAALVIRGNRAARKKPNVPIYDIEGLRRNLSVFKEGEEVVVTEKIHGCNARYIHTGKKFHVASRTMFRESGNTDYWHQAAKTFGLEGKLKQYPGLVLFGEIFGADCQDLDYGCPKGTVGFVAFDAMDVKTRKYMDPQAFAEFCDTNGIPRVPVLYQGPWNLDLVELAEGKTTMGANHCREGFVVRPVTERTEHGIGRCFLKMVGETYHLRKTQDAA